MQGAIATQTLWRMMWKKKCRSWRLDTLELPTTSKKTIHSAGRIAAQHFKELWKVRRCASTVIRLKPMLRLNCQLLFHWFCQYSQIQLSKHMRMNGDSSVSWPGQRGHGGWLWECPQGPGDGLWTFEIEKAKKGFQVGARSNLPRY